MGSGSEFAQLVAELLLPWLLIHLHGFNGLLDGLHEALHFTVGSWPQRVTFWCFLVLPSSVMISNITSGVSDL